MPLCVCCFTAHCISQALALGRTFDWFYPLAAYIKILDLMRASSHRESFQAKSTFNLPSPAFDLLQTGMTYSWWPQCISETWHVKSTVREIISLRETSPTGEGKDVAVQTH